MMPKRRFSKILLFAVFILIGTELVLRLVFDLGEKPLYQADKNCEYFLKPHQNISRFHNNYQTNSYGMRAKPISKHDKKRILLVIRF